MVRFYWKHSLEFLTNQFLRLNSIPVSFKTIIIEQCLKITQITPISYFYAFQIILPFRGFQIYIDEIEAQSIHWISIFGLLQISIIPFELFLMWIDRRVHRLKLLTWPSIKCRSFTTAYDCFFAHKAGQAKKTQF